MSVRAVLQVFEKYQKERTYFVSQVAELAQSPASAALAIGRLASYSDDLAEAVVQCEIIPTLVHSLAEQNRFYKKAATFCLKAVARHSAALALNVIDSGALPALVSCIEEFDPGVKEGACWALGHIAQHNAQLAQKVVDQGAVSLIVLAIQEPELYLRRVAISVLGEIAKHTPELAQFVVDSGAVALIAPVISNQDGKLKRQACNCLAQITKHSVDMAETVVAADIFPKVFTCLKFPDNDVRRNCATLIREIVKHTPELAQLVVSNGGVGAIVDFLNESKGNFRLPGIMALGYIAAFSETLALGVIVEKGLVPLSHVIKNETEDHLKAAAIWTLGQIGRHTPDHAKAVADTGALLDMYLLEFDQKSSEDLKAKCRRALKSVVQKLTYLPALDVMVHKDLPEGVMKIVLEQIGRVLAHDPTGRASFVQSGGLARAQQLAEIQGSKLKEAVDTINTNFPDEIVRYYSPGYSQQLLAKLETNQGGVAGVAT